MPVSSPEPTERGGFNWYTGIFLFVIGFSIALVMLDSIRITARSARWPVTTGRVIVSEPRRVLISWVIGKMSTWPDSGTVQYIRYEYRIDGTVFQSDRFALVPLPRRRALEQANEARMYPVGATVTVHYDAQHPADAVMSTDVPPSVMILLAVGALSLLLGWRLLRETRPGTRRSGSG